MNREYLEGMLAALRFALQSPQAVEEAIEIAELELLVAV